MIFSISPDLPLLQGKSEIFKVLQVSTVAHETITTWKLLPE